MDFDTINMGALARGAWLLREWFPEGKVAGREFLVGSLSGAPGKSLAINMRTGVWCDFASGDKGKGLIHLLAVKEGISMREAALRLAPGAANASQDRLRRFQPRPMSAPKRILPDDPDEGCVADMNALRQLRNLPCWAGLEMARERGLLGFGFARDGGFRVRVWYLTDTSGRVAQWRRLDGRPWASLPGHPKARTAVSQPGEAAWPVGIADAKDRAFIVFCEGGPDLIAAFTLLWLCTSEMPERREGIGIVTLFGASQRLHPDSAVHFKSKTVRIVYHDDEAGKRACVRRVHELLAAGAAKVDAFKITGLTNTHEGKDLNDCMSRDAEAPHPPQLTQLFSK